MLPSDILSQLLVCSEWPPIVNPIFTTATPITRWMVDCTACTCQTKLLHLSFSRGLPLSIQCFRKCDDTSLLGLYSLYSFLFMMSFALLPCFLLLHANDTVRHREAVVAGCVSQKLRCSTMIYGRIVKCQISYLCRNRDARLYKMMYL